MRLPKLDFADVVVIFIAFASACARPGEPRCVGSCDAPPRPTSDAALAYLNNAIDIMQRGSINKYQVDWPSLRARAIEKAAGAQEPAETYSAIVFALGELGDRHSTLVDPEGHESAPAGAKALQGGEMRAQIVGADIAWILLPNTYSVGSSVSWQDQAQRLVADVDRASPCGWIVDLRRNPGGNMWPMIAAIGPLLGEGEIGSFITADSVRTTWFYSAVGEAGLVNSGQRIVLSRVLTPYALRHATPPVAIITGPNTASSGEAVAVAFHGRSITRFFGEPTYGVPTANALFSLGDGAALNLTVGMDVDRNGVVFWPYPLVPEDVRRADVVDPNSAADVAITAAVSWLHAQVACSSNS